MRNLLKMANPGSRLVDFCGGFAPDFSDEDLWADLEGGYEILVKTALLMEGRKDLCDFFFPLPKPKEYYPWDWK